ncbi:MAG: ATP-binding protein, partial [Bacteroidota bacterium]
NRGFSIIKNQEVIHTEETLSVAEYRATRSRFHSLSQQQNTEVWSIAGGAMGLGRMDRQGTIQWNREGRNKDVLGVAHLGDTLLTLDNKHLWYYIGESVVKEVTLEGFFRQVKVLSDGRVVLLGNEGLLEIMGDSVYMHYYQNSPAYSNFYDLEVIDGRIYLGSDRGLLEWSGDSLFQSQTYRFPEQRPIYDILFTSTNQLWLGTNDGVYILQQGRPSRHYSFEDGLAGTEVNRNSLMEGHNGHIWIGTNQGISEYIPDYDLDLSLIPRTSIVSIEASRTSLPTQEDLVLDPEQNTLAFRFRGLSFYNETQINYRIRLHGFDTTWVPLKNSATDITYTNLPTGVSYQLEVQSRLGMGVWSASAKSGSIYIQQPFTSSVLFTVLMIVLAVAIGGLLRFLYGREMNRRWLTKEVAIKTQEIAQSEEELRAQNENLLKINKELDRFVYSASHDLSAPLKSIRGLLHIAKLDKQAGQLQQDQYLAMIDKSVNQLEKFIGELIDFSRNSRLEPKFVSVSLSELVPQLLENLQFMDHFHRVKFSFAWGEGADHIMADEFRLKVILNNLLTNAVKFQRLDRDEVWVKLGSRKTSKGWEIWVEDNGQGIEEDMQPKIFDMFFRANEAASGSGLGLYIAHEAVQRMGGTISLSSIPRQGATFLVFIPFT